MEMASALLWGPGPPAGLHFLTFGQTCVPPTSPPAVWPLFLSGVPSLAVSTSPVPACLSGSLAVTSPAQDGLPKEGVCPFLLVEQRAGGEGEGETQRQRRGQGHRDGARDIETQRRGQRHRDGARDTEIQGQREGETWRDTETHSREGGRSSVCRVSGFGPGSVQRKLVCKDLRPGQQSQEARVWPAGCGLRFR